MMLRRFTSGGVLLAALALATGALFKIAAFAREAFIASRFGLSSLTDAYFAFQQFPLVVVTFMFGAFALAFTPAYAAEKKERGQVNWLPGLLAYGGALGLSLTLLTTLLAPWLLNLFANSAPHGAATLVILSCSFAPVIWLGIWGGVAIANGRNLLAMFVGGLPYLLMTLLLLALFALGRLDDLSLPVSFLAGFGSVGLCALAAMLASECKGASLSEILVTWRMRGFRRFMSELAASSVENLGFSANQLLLLYFVAQLGAGAVSANNCSMRVGMIGFSLLGQPLAQLVQAKLCVAGGAGRAVVFRKWLLAVSSAVLAFAAVLFALREPVTRLVYLHGKFSDVELSRVVDIMPAWIAYFVVASLNALAARYLFSVGKARGYVTRQLGAYAAANLIRLVFWSRLGASDIVWCSVLAEGLAFVASLVASFQDRGAILSSQALVEAHEA